MKNAALSLPLVIAATSLVATGWSATTAHADILSVRGEARAGASLGRGMFGELKDEAFHQERGNIDYGVLVGAELFFIDAWIQHDQFISDGGVNGTWTQFMTGLDVEIDFEDEGSKAGAGGTWFAELGMGIGFGVGTGQQVDPPLDNSEVTDKGFLFEARGLVGYRLTGLLSVGASVPVQFGYFTKSGAGAVANNVDNHYSSMGGAALLTFRATWQLK
ncbi:MAG: hypothetical protein GY811_30205 [Myxococcales bacterium]|nr:hypothetical protein [Myxococcales bacterium]